MNEVYIITWFTTTERQIAVFVTRQDALKFQAAIKENFVVKCFLANLVEISMT